MNKIIFTTILLIMISLLLPKNVYVSNRNWKISCLKEFRQRQHITFHEGKNAKARNRIKRCISLLTDQCILFLYHVCPLASKPYLVQIKKAQKRNKLKRFLQKHGTPF